MPDSYDNVGPSGTSSSSVSDRNPSREINIDINHDEPALAVTERMEMSAPMESVAPTDVPGEVPHQEERPEKPVIPVPPLRENVAPFSTPEPRVPATEYVSIAPEQLPRQVPRSVAPVAPNPPAVPAANGQAIGPIIRKRPQVPEALKVVNPVNPMPAAAPKQAPVQEFEPVAGSVITPPSPVAEQAPVPVPVPMPAMPAAAQMAAELAPEQAISMPPVGTVLGSMPAANKPVVVFSGNTRTVWEIRRAGKMLALVASLGLILVACGLYIYWQSIGSPTHIQDIPLLHLR